MFALIQSYLQSRFARQPEAKAVKLLLYLAALSPSAPGRAIALHNASAGTRSSNLSHFIRSAPARAQVKRDSFAHYFSQQKEQNEVTWTPTPLEALLDVDQVIEAWRLRGITIHRARRARAAWACTSGRSRDAIGVQIGGVRCMPHAAFAAGLIAVTTLY